jgi:hypothetical protein
MSCTKIAEEPISEVAQDLRWAGISEDTIFPDLSGLGRDHFNLMGRTAAQIHHPRLPLRGAARHAGVVSSTLRSA